TVANIMPAGPARRAFWDSYFFGAPRDAFLAGDEPRFADAVEQQLASPGQAPAAGRISLLEVCEDPELLTLKAHRLLLEADIIVHDRSVAPGVLEFARRDALRRSVDTSIWSRNPDHHQWTAETLLTEAGAGRRIVRLYDANASALDSELTALGARNTTSIAIDHIRSAPDEHTWSPLIDGQNRDGITQWRLAS
ncbi:MAG: SAM-dependent methyltransferase, partial [Hyphomicrobiales bacterium]|nr:SAM-dependent methyltransferase [Hyphomicrobiales bacterium]